VRASIVQGFKGVSGGPRAGSINRQRALRLSCRTLNPNRHRNRRSVSALSIVRHMHAPTAAISARVRAESARERGTRSDARCVNLSLARSEIDSLIDSPMRIDR
jgi:hypothetical protein